MPSDKRPPTAESPATSDAPAAPPARKRGRGADTATTKAALMDAAFDAVLTDGYAAVTARSLADRAKVNQAAIYYHFGGIEQLLLAALDRSGQQRLDVYEGALSEPMSLSELIGRLESLYELDRASGHLRVVTQMVAGAAFSPEIADGVRATVEPWIEFVEHKVKDAVETLPFGGILSPSDVAELIFSLVIGVETRSQIEAQPGLVDRLFRVAKLGALMLESNVSPTADAPAPTDE